MLDEPDEISRRLRTLWVLDLVRRGSISAARGGELLELNRFEMYDEVVGHGMPVCDWDDDELEHELAATTRLFGTGAR